MKFVHGHKLEFHATMDMNRLDHSCMLNGLPTFFMAEKFERNELKLYVDKFYHGTNLNFPKESSFGNKFYFTAFLKRARSRSSMAV